jgi:hypothetical protein
MIKATGNRAFPLECFIKREGGKCEREANCDDIACQHYLSESAAGVSALSAAFGAGPDWAALPA